MRDKSKFEMLRTLFKKVKNGIIYNIISHKYKLFNDKVVLVHRLLTKLM